MNYSFAGGDGDDCVDHDHDEEEEDAVQLGWDDVARLVLVGLLCLGVLGLVTYTLDTVRAMFSPAEGR